jgi:tRNA (guanine37-N1)-methyltransferase
MMTFHVITLFPDAFKSYLGESIVARAIRDKKIAVKFYNPRDYTKDKWARVDRRPYGGGPGMVLEAPAIIKAIDSALKRAKNKKIKVIIFSADGKVFENVRAKLMADKGTDIVLVCGRYEGVDARVKKIFKAEEISVGPYVLTGGELPAMIIVDAVARQIEGVLGNFDSVEERRVATSEVYTRPEILKYKGKTYRVPKVLLSGHRANIDIWKQGRKKAK